MKLSTHVHFLLLLTLGMASLLLPVGFASASATNGTITGFAWSDRVGWVNFGATSSNAAITDFTLTGYAWNENTGWIRLDPTKGGVANDGNGKLSGRAWAEGFGWINFSGVTINSSGVFAGTATGDNSTDIAFGCSQCNVNTDWRPISARGTSSGILALIPPSMSINLGSAYTNNPNVAISFKGGAGITEIAISNSADFSGKATVPYQSETKWILSGQDGLKTVYAKFFNASGAMDSLSSTILLDTSSPSLVVASLQSVYSPEDNAAISGTAEPGAKVIVLVDDQQYGSVDADAAGNWTVNLGKLPAGSHRATIYAKDLAGNASAVAFADFSVQSLTEEKPSGVLEKVAEGIKSLLPEFLSPKPQEAPGLSVTVPKSAPLPLKGKIEYFSKQDLEKFVLAPLPAEIQLLAMKFPHLEETLEKIGVTNAADVEKLRGAKLKLPTLTEVASGIGPGDFVLLEGIPVTSLSAEGKSRIPSEVVFSKTAGGWVDYTTSLSVNNEGKAEQKISTIAGQSLQLIVKSARPAKNVVGYVIFRSRAYAKGRFEIPLKDLRASLIFASPNLVADQAPNTVIELSNSASAGSINAGEAKPLPLEDEAYPSSGDQSKTERRLALAKFEYVNTGQEVYTATVQSPAVDGEYEVVTVIDYGHQEAKKEIQLIIVVDPEGYVYQQTGEFETRIAGAVVSLYWLNPDAKKYDLWPAKKFQQTNPQTTDKRGTYSFLVPEGMYYLQAHAPGHTRYEGQPFEVKEGRGVHVNIALKRKVWFLRIVERLINN